LAALLAKIFNRTALIGGYPKIWKRNRRIIIPKPTKALCGANGWQPITPVPVGSCPFGNWWWVK